MNNKYHDIQISGKDLNALAPTGKSHYSRDAFQFTYTTYKGTAVISKKYGAGPNGNLFQPILP
jgi:hypothetical protein